MWLLNPYWYTAQYSAAVSNYLDQVIAADVAAGNLLGLEDGTKTAYATFIDNLIVDGYLGVSGGTISQVSSVMKASPILAGARTLAGALVPLVGTAPTNFNFVSGDYNRKTGLVGDGSTKYLNSNRNNAADPQNSQHMCVYPTAVNTTDGDRVYMGTGFLEAGSTYFFTRTGDAAVRNRSATADIALSRGVANALIGTSRSASAAFTYRRSGSSLSVGRPSQAPANGDVFVYRSNGFSQFSNARLAFYSIGESLDLALLDVRVTTLINTFGATIP